MPVLTNISHELFAQAIARGENYRDAYEHAGYQRTAASATRLLKNISVKMRVKELIEEAARLTTIDVAWVLEELATVARFDIGELVEFGPIETKTSALKSPGAKRKATSYVKLTKHSEDLPPHVRRAIAKIKMGTYGVEIEVHNKMRALDLLGNHLDMWKKTEKKDGASLADLVLESMKITGAKRPGDDARVINGEVNDGGE